MQRRTVLAFRPDAAEWQTLRELRAQTGLSYSRIIGTMLREKAELGTVTENFGTIPNTTIRPLADTLRDILGAGHDTQTYRASEINYGSELKGCWPSESEWDAYNTLRRDGVPRETALRQIFPWRFETRDTPH